MRWILKSSYKLLKSILDTIPDNIVVIDEAGDIQFVNKNWIAFAKENQCSIKSKWKGINYLKACNATPTEDSFGREAAKGIRSVIANLKASFYLEYPCHGKNEKRWFMMRVDKLELGGPAHYVISHRNITTRKKVEERVLNLSRIDGLTNIANRRYFDEFLSDEWKRCARLSQPLSLAIIDIDYFKLLNDTYGHQVGDQCLKTIGALLKRYAKRSGDICARYGGEEFALILSNTDLNTALKIVTKLMDSIRNLMFANKKSPILPIVTASIGLVTLVPKSHKNKNENENAMIDAADKQLYLAKNNGRNQIACEEYKNNSPTNHLFYNKVNNIKKVAYKRY